MASDKTKEYREKVASEFINSLSEKELEWKKQWAGHSVPVNSNGRKYNGINRFYLTILMMANDWKDNRFYTFKQIQANEWKLPKGTKGVQVEYWMPYDREAKKSISWGDYKEFVKEMTPEEVEERFGLTARYYTVFNGSLIEGIPELKLEKNDITPDELIDRIAKGIDIEIKNDGGDKAFYRPSEDKIHLPEAEYFVSDYAYNSTALHELAHATGASHRLNRPLCGFFGSEEYAKEELVAEITSAFMGAYLGDGNCEEIPDLDNHKAYIQSWIQAVKEKPESLFQAIKDAEAASAYMEEKAGLVKAKGKEEVENEVEKPRDRGRVA